MFQLGGMLGQQNLSPAVQHVKARHTLCALTAPQHPRKGALAQAVHTWGAVEQQVLRLPAVPSALQKTMEALQERTALSLCLPDISHPTRLQGQVAFLVADRSRHSQHRPVQMGNTRFRAALSKIQDFKVYAGLAVGSQSVFKGTGYMQQNVSAPGRQEEPLEQCLCQTEGM